MRQHLASLVAVFLALLIGVLAGVGLIRQPGLESRIEELKLQVQNRDEREQLRGRVAAEFADRALPALMRGKLVGRKAALFVTATDRGNTTQDSVRYALDLAGATVVTRATFDVDFVRHCDERREELVSALGVKANPGEAVAEAIAREVAQAITQGDTAAFQSLRRRGIVRIDEEHVGKPTLAIVVGGAKMPDTTHLEGLDLPLIRYLKSSESIDCVVGCETSDVLESVMRAYQKEDISTVDNVDTAPGQFSLVLALAGVEGHYGMKPGARRYFPEMPEEP